MSPSCGGALGSGFITALVDSSALCRELHVVVTGCHCSRRLRTTPTLKPRPTSGASFSLAAHSSRCPDQLATPFHVRADKKRHVAAYRLEALPRAPKLLPLASM